MRLRLPSCAFSWAKTAAKPAVSRSGDGNQGEQLPVPGRRQRSPSVFSMSSTSETASSRERRSWPVTASWRAAGSDSVWIGLA